MSITFPADLLLLAEAVGNGELFWPVSIADRVARVIARADLGIYGGEVYASHGNTWGNVVHEWLTDPPWRDSEPWDEYVARGLAQALAQIAQAAALPHPSLAGSTREPMCFLPSLRRDDYPLALLARRST